MIEASVAAIGHRDVPFVLVARLLGVVGLELSARAYPAGGGLRDAAQLALLERLRRRVSGPLAWRSEVPIPIEGDLRAWDAALVGPRLTIGIDAETRIRDIQAVDRRVMLKLRDSAFDRAVLLVASTKSNRTALHQAGSGLQANYPIATRAALRALAAGEDPGGKLHRRPVASFLPGRHIDHRGCAACWSFLPQRKASVA